MRCCAVVGGKTVRDDLEDWDWEAGPLFLLAFLRIFGSAFAGVWLGPPARREYILFFGFLVALL